MLQTETRCIKSRGVKTFEQDEDLQIFLILLKYLFFSFSTALRQQQMILACFPEDKLSTIYLDLQIQKVFTPWHATVYMYIYIYIYIYVLKNMCDAINL